MCGIAGIVSLGGPPVLPRAIVRMCDVLAHRGPDDAGYAFFESGGRRRQYVDPTFRHIHPGAAVLEDADADLDGSAVMVGFGHRRLSVLDVTPAGHQPMTSADERRCIVHNGEIYNFRELRAELEGRGHTFTTRTDTEVLLALWGETGPASLTRLDGMFAFALYDRQANVLTLARDRFGVKPLYYACIDGALIFASEPKGIFASGLLEPQIDPAALVEYFTFQNLYGQRTLWRDVKILAPGETLTVRPGAGREPVVGRFHRDFPEMDPGLTDTDTVVEELARLFEQAVQRQLVSDVPVGSYLSGGMDSGSIVAVAGRSIPRLYTFTGGFDLTNVNGIEQGFDERRLAEQLSYLLQTEHYDVVLHAGDMPAAMERITWHMDDPRVGMCHQNWYVAKLASKFVKVCLAGTGGDELFAGYPWRYRLAAATGDIDSFDRDYYRYWHRLLSPEDLPNLFSPDLRGHCTETWESFRGVLGSAPRWRDDATPLDNLLQRALYFEFRTFLHGLLVTEDHISMAHSLETRVPFLDVELADFAWRIPPSMKLRIGGLGDGSDGHLETADGKHILRRAMENYLPAEFVHQKKQGFSPPDENWYRGPSMDYIKTVLWDTRTRQRPWFDQESVDRLLNEHFEGRRNNRLMIWSLLSIEWLQRHYLDAARTEHRETCAAVTAAT